MRKNFEDDFENKYKEKKDINYKNKGWLGLLFNVIICIFLLYEVVNLVLYTFGKKDEDDLHLYKFTREFTSIVIPKSVLENKKTTVNYAGLSDIYVTPNMLSGAKQIDGTYDFKNGIDDVIDKLKKYDLVTASLNTPIASKNLLYSTVKYYNCPVELLDTIKKLNISMLATATYHINDKESKGIQQTIKNLESNSIKYTGISENVTIEPMIIAKNDINFGFLSYAEKSNEKDDKSNINLFSKDKVQKDIKFLDEKNVDFKICYLNFIDNTDSISSTQKQIVEDLFNLGVDIVLCTGNKKVQSSMEDIIKIENNQKHVYTIYSMGNFMGAYNSEVALVSCMADITFSKEVFTDKKGDIKKVKKDFKVNTPIGFYTDISKKFEKQVYIINNKELITKQNDYKSDFNEKIDNINQQFKRLFQ